MSTYNVFLDSNIFIKAKYGFCSGSLLHLKKYCNDGIITLFTNDIITREVKRHITTDVKLLASQAKNAIRKHPELLNSMTAGEFKAIQTRILSSPERLIAAYDAYMQGSVVLSNDGISVIDLFNDYFAPSPPFEAHQDKKSEFPDAAVIMSIRQYLSSTEGCVVHVVTDDVGWHNALKKTPGIFLYGDIKSLLTEVSRDKEVLYRRIVAFVEENIRQLQDSAESWIYEQEWDFVVDDLDMCIECEEMDEVDAGQIELAPDGIEYIDTEEESAVVALSGTAKVRIGFSYIDHTNELYDKEDHVWYNTEYGDGRIEIEVPVRSSVTVLLSGRTDGELELDAPEFEELEKSRLEIIECELTERCDDIRDPYYNICPDCGEKIGLHNDGGDGFCAKCGLNH